MEPKVVPPPKPDTSGNEGNWVKATDHAAPSKPTKTDFAVTDAAAKSVLLHAVIGIWDDNQGRMCLLADFHGLYGFCIKVFQTDSKPIQLFIAPCLRDIMQKVDRYGDATAAGGPGGELYLIFKDGLTRAHVALTTNNNAAALI